MGSIGLLDCTLRDGGYVNEWAFGYECIREICHSMAKADIDIVELGFLRDVIYEPNIAIFNNMNQVSDVICEKYTNILYAVMCEATDPLPLKMIKSYTNDTADIIRVIVWKQRLCEGYEYCKGIVDRGYKLCVQPNRVEQYSFNDFKDIIELFNTLDPLGFYVVDSFGILNCDQIMKYIDIANEYLKPEIYLGYHGHNNLMQAYGTAETFINKCYLRNILIDASIHGIGRGAGNLNIELISKYLNENFDKSYNLYTMYVLWEKYIRKIKDSSIWGYTIGYYLSALYRCNPMYAEFYETKMNLSSIEIDNIFRSISNIDRIIFTEDKAIYYWKNNIEGRCLL